MTEKPYEFSWDLGPLEIAPGAVADVEVCWGWRVAHIDLIMALHADHFGMRVQICRRDGEVIDTAEKPLAAYRSREMRHCESVRGGDVVHFFVRNVTETVQMFHAVIFGRAFMKRSAPP